MTLGLDLDAKKTEREATWSLIILEVVIARLYIIVKPGQVVTGFKTEWVIIALGREEGYKISNVLLLELEEDIKRRKEAFCFFLCFLLVTRVKVIPLVSDVLIVISILGEGVRTKSGPWIVLIAFIRVGASDWGKTLK